jgi:hypothetical protein
MPPRIRHVAVVTTRTACGRMRNCSTPARGPSMLPTSIRGAAHPEFGATFSHMAIAWRSPERWTLSALHNAAWWLERTDAECSAFAPRRRARRVPMRAVIAPLRAPSLGSGSSSTRRSCPRPQRARTGPFRARGSSYRRRSRASRVVSSTHGPARRAGRSTSTAPRGRPIRRA